MLNKNYKTLLTPFWFLSCFIAINSCGRLNELKQPSSNVEDQKNQELPNEYRHLFNVTHFECVGELESRFFALSEEENLIELTIETRASEMHLSRTYEFPGEVEADLRRVVREEIRKYGGWCLSDKDNCRSFYTHFDNEIQNEYLLEDGQWISPGVTKELRYLYMPGILKESFLGVSTSIGIDYANQRLLFEKENRGMLPKICNSNEKLAFRFEALNDLSREK